MLGFVLRSLRSALGVVEHDVTTPFEETEREMLDAVEAIHRATDSIEHHVEVIEGLATSVGPLTDSVDRLTATMQDLVVLMAPMGSAEHGIKRAEHFLGFAHHKETAESEAGRDDT